MNEKCYFCGSYADILDEHYIYCPYCGAHYTFLIVHEKGCEHIDDNSPTVFIKSKISIHDKPYIVEDEDANTVCSKCGAECFTDGW